MFKGNAMFKVVKGNKTCLFTSGLMSIIIMASLLQGCGSKNPQYSATASNVASITSKTKFTASTPKSTAKTSTTGTTGQHTETDGEKIAGGNGEGTGADNPDGIENNNGKEILPEENPRDLGGKTIHIYTAFTAWLPTQINNEYGQKRVKREEYIEQKYNCNIEWSVAGTAGKMYNDFVAASLAGVDIGDIINCKPTYQPFVTSELILPLDDYIDFNEPPFNMSFQNAYIRKGLHYAVATSVPVIDDQNAMILYNRDILNRVGGPDIVSLYRQGQWNWETFLDAAKSATQDLNGDGIIDQWGLYSFYPKFFLSGILMNNGANYVIPDPSDNSKLVYGLSALESLQAIIFCNQVFYVDKVAPVPSLDMPNYFVNNMALFQAGGPGGSISLDGFPESTSILFYPQGPHGTGYVSVGDGGWPFIVPSYTSNKEDSAFILGELCNLVDPSWSDRFEDFCQTGSSYAQGFTNIPEDTAIFNDMLKNYRVQYSGVIAGLEDATTAQIVNRCLLGGEPAATVVESIRPAAEIVLHENWNK